MLALVLMQRAYPCDTVLLPERKRCALEAVFDPALFGV
jgi:hypothetical protein